MIDRPSLILASLLLSLTCQAARVQQSPEAVAAGAIAAWTRMCAEVNGGKAPANWTEYRETLNFSINDVLSTTQPTRRYGVMSPPVPLLPPLSGVMLVVNRHAIQDTQVPPGFLGLSHVLKEPGRYVIYRDSAGEYKYQWMTEDYIVKVFAAAGLQLPEPDDEAERPWVAEARESMALRRWVVGGLVALMLVVGGGMLWSRKRTGTLGVA